MPLGVLTRGIVSPRGMLPRAVWFSLRRFLLPRFGAWCPSHSIEELNGLTQTSEFEQVVCGGCGIAVARRIRVRAAQSDGEVSSIRPLDDEVGIDPRPPLNDFDSLALERMGRMGDCHQSRTRSGFGGSVWRTRQAECRATGRDR